MRRYALEILLLSVASFNLKKTLKDEFLQYFKKLFMETVSVKIEVVRDTYSVYEL